MAEVSRHLGGVAAEGGLRGMRPLRFFLILAAFMHAPSAGAATGHQARAAFVGPALAAADGRGIGLDDTHRKLCPLGSRPLCRTGRWRVNTLQLRALSASSLRGGGEQQQAPTAPKNPVRMLQVMALQSMIVASIAILEVAEAIFVLGNLCLKLAWAVAWPVRAWVNHVR